MASPPISEEATPRVAVPRPSRRLLLAAGLMAGTGIAVNALKLRPEQRARAEPLDLELAVPRVFSDWRQEVRGSTTIVNPDAKAMLDRIYAQILNRTYVNADGYPVMLAIAYGSDQRGSLQAHRPEICYPAQGFVLQDSQSGTIGVDGGELAVRRLKTSMGARKEPVTYWFTVGDRNIDTTLDRKLAELKAALTGRVPDGLLFRVSSIDPEAPRAFRMHEEFVRRLIAAVDPRVRVRLSGLAPG